jgi:hypothetical protein
MNDPNQQPEYNDAQDDDDRQPPRKGSKWRKKAGTDEAYDPTPPPDVAPDSRIEGSGRGDNRKAANRDGYETAPPPDKAPGLTDYVTHKQDVSEEDDQQEEDDDPALDYELNLGTDDDDVTSNAPNLSNND